jgi:hypothetical protein
LLERFDANAYAASVRVHALKPNDRTASQGGHTNPKRK